MTDADLSQSLLYKVAIFAVLVAIASGGERLLFKISGPMVVVKVGIIVVFGFAMIPHWNFANITAFPQASVFSFTGMPGWLCLVRHQTHLGKA